MCAMNRVLILISILCLPALVSAQQALQPIDMFRLDYFMTMGSEDPVAWLDGEHYLVFDAGKHEICWLWGLYENVARHSEGRGQPGTPI